MGGAIFNLNWARKTIKNSRPFDTFNECSRKADGFCGDVCGGVVTIRAAQQGEVHIYLLALANLIIIAWRVSFYIRSLGLVKHHQMLHLRLPKSMPTNA